MPNVLVRDVDVAVLDKIKFQAKQKNRSLQAEMKVMMADAANRRERLSGL